MREHLYLAKSKWYVNTFRSLCAFVKTKVFFEKCSRFLVLFLPFDDQEVLYLEPMVDTPSFLCIGNGQFVWFP